MPVCPSCLGRLSRLAVLFLSLSGAIHADPAFGPDTDADSQGATEEVRALFRMCCWANGRAGFQYCTEYGACRGNPGNTCTGRGAAAGLVLGCGDEPGDAAGTRWFLLPSP